MLKSKKSLIKNNKGMAVFEMIPIIVVVVLLINFALGFFGVIHTGIMNSIASRNYAFSTFSHRANLTYFRNTTLASLSYEKQGLRFHGTVSESAASSGSQSWAVTTRKINFFGFSNSTPDENMQSGTFHAQKPATVCDYLEKGCSGTVRNEGVDVNPVWIKTRYGICLNAACSGS